jgi:hypothetical protein
MTFTEWSHRHPSRYDSGIPFYFMQTSLCPLLTHEMYVFAHLTRHSPLEKVQFTMGPAFSRQCLKVERKLLSEDLLRVLEKHEKKDFIHAITRDESCFYIEYLHQLVWAQSRDEVPERIKQRLTGKSVWFQSFDRLTEFTICSMCPKNYI